MPAPWSATSTRTVPFSGAFTRRMKMLSGPMWCMALPSRLCSTRSIMAGSAEMVQSVSGSGSSSFRV